MEIVTSKLFGVLVKPQEVAPALLKEPAHVRRHLLLFDDYFVAHAIILYGPAKQGQTIGCSRSTLLFLFCRADAAFLLGFLDDFLGDG